MRDAHLKRGRGLAEAGLLWLVPAALGLSGWLWQRLPWMTTEFLCYALLTPALGMTLNVAIGAGALRLWRFNVPYSVGGVAPQIGLIYAAVINLVALTMAELLVAPGLAAALWFVLLVAAITAVLGVIYDLIAVHFGLLEVYVGAHYRGEGAWAIVRSYGFQFFGFVGLLAATSLRAGYWLLVERPAVPWWQAVALGLAVLVLPLVAALLPAYRRKARRAGRRAGGEVRASVTSSSLGPAADREERR